MVDALTLPASVGSEQANLAVVKGRRSRLQAELHALALYGRKVLGLAFLEVAGASDKKQNKRNQSHMCPLSARNLAQEA